MAINYSIDKHTEVYPSKMLAQNGGKHFYNIELANDMDNGRIVARDAWVELDVYKYKASTGVALVVREQASNGNWYVEVTTPGDGILIYQVPVIAEEYNREFKDFANFYNKKGEVVRGYELAVGDIFEISENGFDKTPKAGDVLSVDTTTFKLKTPTAASGGGN